MATSLYFINELEFINDWKSRRQQDASCKNFYGNSILCYSPCHSTATFSTWILLLNFRGVEGCLVYFLKTTDFNI